MSARDEAAGGVDDTTNVVSAHIVSALETLLRLAYAVDVALDDSEDVGDGTHVLDHEGVMGISDALDALDELPDDCPDYTMGPAAKARWALRHLIGEGDTVDIAKLTGLLSPPAPPPRDQASSAMLGALEELVRIRDWCVEAGGADGPLPSDVIRKFAEQQVLAIDAARAAIALARSAGIEPKGDAG